MNSEKSMIDEIIEKAIDGLCSGNAGIPRTGARAACREVALAVVEECAKTATSFASTTVAARAIRALAREAEGSKG